MIRHSVTRHVHGRIEVSPWCLAGGMEKKAREKGGWREIMCAGKSFAQVGHAGKKKITKILRAGDPKQKSKTKLKKK